MPLHTWSSRDSRQFSPSPYLLRKHPATMNPHHYQKMIPHRLVRPCFVQQGQTARLEFEAVTRSHPQQIPSLAELLTGRINQTNLMIGILTLLSLRDGNVYQSQ